MDLSAATVARHELLELAGRIPSEYKFREKKTKWIFKEALEVN